MEASASTAAATLALTLALATRAPRAWPIHLLPGSVYARATRGVRRIALPTGRATASSAHIPDRAGPVPASTETAASARSRLTSLRTVQPPHRGSAPRCGVDASPHLSLALPPSRLASTRLAASTGAEPTPGPSDDHVWKRLPLVTLGASVSQLRPGADVLRREANAPLGECQVLEFLDRWGIEPCARLAPRALADAPRGCLENVPAVALPLYGFSVVLIARRQALSATLSSCLFEVLDCEPVAWAIAIRAGRTPVTSENGARPSSPGMSVCAAPVERRVVVLVAVRLARATVCTSQSGHGSEARSFHPGAGRAPSSGTRHHSGWRCLPAVSLGALPAVRRPKA